MFSENHNHKNHVILLVIPIFFVKNKFLDPKNPYFAILGNNIGEETAEKELLDKNLEILTSEQIITILCIAVTKPVHQLTGTGLN